ncbi:MAG: TolC family protein [Bacteroidia bacterium]
MTKKIIFILFIINSWFCAAIAQSNNLDFYIQQAISNSPLLKDYQNQVLSNGLDSLLIKASYKPQVNFISNNVYYPVINGYGYDQAITNGGSYSALVGVSQAIVGKNIVSAQLQSIQLLNESLKNSVKITEQDLKRSITAQYISAYGDITQYNLNKELVDLLRKEELILKDLTEKGIYRQTDYLTFLVSVQQQELVLKQVTIQYKNNIATLNYLCGITDTAAVYLIEPNIKVETLPSINNSLFFKQFKLDSLTLINKKLLVDIKYRPKISLFADGGYNSTLTQLPYKDFGTSLGFSFALPIYDGKQRKLNYSKVALADKTRTAYSDFFTRQYQQRIKQLTQQLNETNGLIIQINMQLKYAEALITANRKLLSTGDARISDYLIATTSFLNLKNQLTINTINRLQIINQINYWNR